MANNKWGQTVSTSDWAKRVRITVSICISFIALVLGSMYIFSNSLDRWHLDGKAVGFLVAAALPWIIDRLDSFKGFGFEFKRRLDEQQAAIQEQQELAT